jgi:CARDB
MHVRLAILLVLLVAATAPAAHAATPAGVRMLTCEGWNQGSGGLVVYRAHMRAVPGTARMALRIRLFEKYGDGDFERVSAEGLGVWRRSQLDASVFRYKQRVEGLRQGAVYRVVVKYRWLDADGATFQTARRRSVTCSQGGGLPNLRVASVETRPGEVEDTAIYKVKVVNQGTSAAHNVGVLLRVDGEVVDEAEVIEMLEPNEARTVTFHGPVCRRRMRVVVDPNELIAESREQDNVLGPSCL